MRMNLTYAISMTGTTSTPLEACFTGFSGATKTRAPRRKAMTMVLPAALGFPTWSTKDTRNASGVMFSCSAGTTKTGASATRTQDGILRQYAMTPIMLTPRIFWTNGRRDSFTLSLSNMDILDQHLRRDSVTLISGRTTIAHVESRTSLLEINTPIGGPALPTTRVGIILIVLWYAMTMCPSRDETRHSVKCMVLVILLWVLVWVHELRRRAVKRCCWFGSSLIVISAVWSPCRQATNLESSASAPAPVVAVTPKSLLLLPGPILVLRYRIVTDPEVPKLGSRVRSISSRGLDR
ncbi:hypothetical protein B0H16DRAFT_1897665 [Mycena metata]|uniref:Uncharacterized protein n=1 Tax=Mycena metata TaxID=1033252 RepID=A0AAD7HE78_9AGAR|nr:hypothetical protein B0H16DRAFT_1897665 [Mycena metata]